MSEAYNAKYWESQDRIPTIKTRSPKNPNTWRITDNNYGDDTWYTIQFPEEVNEDTRIIISCGGAGGWTDSESVISANRNENAIVIMPQSQNNDNYRAIIRISNEIASNNPRFRGQLASQGVKINGVPSNSCVTFGAHSNSSKEIVSATVNYLTNEHANGRETRAAVLINDAEHTSLVGNGSVKNSYLEHKGELDDSIIFATTQKYYLSEDASNGLVSNKGCAPESYLADLEDMAKSGATVMLTTYDMHPEGWNPEGNNWHTESVELTSAMGLYDLERGTLDDGPLSFVTQRPNQAGKTITAELKYYYFDVEKDSWVAYSSAEEAQAQLDISTSKVAMYNAGLLSKADGQYTVKLNGKTQEISSDDLDSFLLACKKAYNESDTSKKTFEEFMEEYSTSHPIGRDSAEYNLNNMKTACLSLQDTLSEIHNHITSFGTFKNLKIKNSGKPSKFLKNMNSFPRGVSFSGLDSSMDCINKLDSNLEAALEASNGVYNATAIAEGEAPTFFQSNTHGNAANKASEDVSNFAQDLK